MTNKTTITINGRLYDAKTGKPVADVEQKLKTAAPQQGGSAKAFSDIGPRPIVSTPRVQPKSPADRNQHPGAQTIHSRPQKSQTLYRKALKKPVAQHPEASMTTKDLPTRSPLITKFGGPITVHQDLTRKAHAAKTEEADVPAQVHPTVAKVMQQNIQQPQPAMNNQELKEQLIKERLAEVDDAPHKAERRSWLKSKPRLASILTASLALLVLGGYLTYMNLPVISMKVAASRAGVNATLPNYHPDGYGLSGPITYSPGEVNINYKSNTNDDGFKISQKPSNWDSQGLLDNYITRQTENYLTLQERGVTVYTFGNKAAWVNGGLLYTLEGSASLSSDQILHLATSM